MFESLDDDKMKRTISPIILTSDSFGVTNVLNTFMDHLWDGFYTSQLRLSRWPALVSVGPGVKYNIEYTGTAPKNQRFTLNADQSSIIIRIRYTKPGVYVL